MLQYLQKQKITNKILRGVNLYKYLVELFYIPTSSTEPLVICDTEEKAQEWIIKEMTGCEYSGNAYHRIIRIKHYK